MPDGNDLMRVLTGFNTVFHDAGIGIEIFVEKKIPDDGNPLLGEPARDFL